MLFKFRCTGHGNEKKPVGQLLLEHNLISIENLQLAQSDASEREVSMAPYEDAAIEAKESAEVLDDSGPTL